MGPMMMQKMQEKGMQGWLETLKTAKELGNVTVNICANTADLMDLKIEDFEDIGGGIAETGCMPSYADLQDDRYGELIRKYLKAGKPSWETRGKVARLIEWLTLGAGVPGCMHGGGSPDGAKLMIRRNIDLEKNIEMAKRIANIEEGSKPRKKK